MYTPAQRAALAAAYFETGMTSTKVAQLAAEEKLMGVDGKRLPAFEANASTIRSIARRALRRQDDTGPELSARLLNTLSRRAHAEARKARTSREIDAAARALERVEKARSVLQATRPRVKAGEPGGLAGKILADHRATRDQHLARASGELSAEPAPKPPPEPAPAPKPEREMPGEWARRQAEPFMAAAEAEHEAEKRRSPSYGYVSRFPAPVDKPLPWVDKEKQAPARIRGYIDYGRFGPFSF
jgi:hypothetical protein